MALKVLTYNIRHGLGMDGRVLLDRIQDVLLQSGADLICLQEVDRSLPRSGFCFQAEKIALDLGFHFSFHANFGVLHAGMGNAIVSRYPVYSTWNTALPFSGEPRGLLHSTICVPGRDIDVYCTHWGLSPKQRQQQSIAVRKKITQLRRPYLLCGDFNAIRSSTEIDSLVEGAGLTDAGPTDIFTYPSDIPVAKIDYIFASANVKVVKSHVIGDNASDHSAVFAEVVIAD